MLLFSDHEFASPIRSKILAGAILLVMLTFIGRLVQLQIINSELLAGAAIEQGLKRIERVPVRGSLFDRTGRIVAASVPAFSVAVTPQDFLPHKKETMPLLCKILGLDSNFINVRLNQSGYFTRFQPVKILRDADARTIAAIEENQELLPGVDVIAESKREYIAPIRAAHLIGYTKEISESMLKKKLASADSDYYHAGDVVGTTGLEAYHEPSLRGVKGYEFVAVDARGQQQSRLNEGRSDINSIDGASIQLGMDIDLQLYGEQLLEGHHGAIVALDPSNGEILALVSKPDFDLDLFSGKTTKAEYQAVMLDPAHPLFNRALQTKYPPGSTWKMMMACAALQTKTVPFNYKINCGGAFVFGNNAYKDVHLHGSGVDFNRSIAASCNVFYFGLAAKMNLDTMWKYARYFGFDTSTGSDIGHEGNGFIPNTKRMNRLYPKGWTKGYVVSHGVGQGEVSVTPMQEASYAACLANKGVWVQPHVARKIYNVVTEKWDTVAYRSRRIPVADTILGIVRRGMYGACNEPGGTARHVQIPGTEFKVAGKTGTAQNPHGKDHAWFICFAPYDNPKIAMCVMVENAGFGGAVAAPIARKMIDLYLTGRREDPLPTLLPNTPEYRADKQRKYEALTALLPKRVAQKVTPAKPAEPKPAMPKPVAKKKAAGSQTNNEQESKPLARPDMLPPKRIAG